MGHRRLHLNLGSHSIQSQALSSKVTVVPSFAAIALLSFFHHQGKGESGLSLSLLLVPSFEINHRLR